MPPIDDSDPPRGPSASDVLLSAALSGLLWVSASCGASSDGADDGGDGGRPVDDAGPRADAGSASDAGTEADAGGSLDAGSTMDAGLPMDAGAGIDAGVTMDAGAPADAGAADAPFCDVLPPDERVITSSSDAGTGMTLEEFTAMCDDLGGYIEIHPHCGGMNSCRGISYDSGTGILTEHTCAGLNTCAGFSCVLPTS